MEPVVLRRTATRSPASLATPSSIALSQLVSEGVHADAAFVDGSHRFHEVFVDLYFLRKIVRAGGMIVVNDDWAPSVRTAVRYYERNLGWKPLPTAFAGENALADQPRPGSRSGTPLPSLETARPVRAAIR